MLHLPAIAEEGDTLGRSPGEAAVSGALRIEDLKATQAALGPFLFNALYQGRPMPLEGNLLRRSSFRYFQDGGGHYVLSRPDAESLIVD